MIIKTTENIKHDELTETALPLASLEPSRMPSTNADFLSTHKEVMNITPTFRSVPHGGWTDGEEEEEEKGEMGNGERGSGESGKWGS